MDRIFAKVLRLKANILPVKFQWETKNKQLTTLKLASTGEEPEQNVQNITPNHENTNNPDEQFGCSTSQKRIKENYTAHKSKVYRCMTKKLQIYNSVR